MREFEEVVVMRIILDHELITVKEAQRILQVSRYLIDEMIKSEQLCTIKVGSQLKIEGKSLKDLFNRTYKANTFANTYVNNDIFINASDIELAMITDWT